jgi:hypothetical protein
LAPGWRTKAFDVALDDLAAEAVALQGDSIATLARQARARHDYDRLLTSANPPWGSLTVMSEEAFYARGKFRVIVEVTPNVRTSFSLRTNAGSSTGMHRPQAGVLLLPDPARFQAQDDPLAVTIRGLPVRVAGPPGGAATSLTVLVPSAPLINGKAGAPGDHALPSLELTAEGVDIRVSGPVNVSVERDRLTVRPVR